MERDIADTATALLSICIPTYERPDRLRVALGSALQTPADASSAVELVVSDNSEDGRSEAVFRELAEQHAGPSRYHRNVPGVGMVGNFNRCIELASGRYVLILHDDDYLLPGGISTMLSWLSRTDRRVVGFGVRVVDDGGRTIRRQVPRRTRYLPPATALERLLGRSSYLRFPAVVVHRSAYADVGTFDPSFAGACDLDMWARLAARYGLLRVAAQTAAYVVHPGADTESVFDVTTVRRVTRVAERTVTTGALPCRVVRRATADFLHQFALAGAIRRLKVGDRRGARSRLDLLDLPEVQRYGTSWRWLPVRWTLRALTGAR